MELVAQLFFLFAEQLYIVYFAHSNSRLFTVVNSMEMSRKQQENLWHLPSSSQA